MAGQIMAAGLPMPILEHRFHKPGAGEKRRLWRFDFAWPEEGLAVEVEGGVWSGGRHTKGAGFHADTIKYNCALEQGWRVLRYTSKSVRDKSAIEQLTRIFAPSMGPFKGE